MNVDEALQVVDRVVDLWPSDTWAEGTVEAWCVQLARYDVSVVAAALEQLHNDRPRRPAWSDLVAVLRAMMRTDEAQAALPAAPADHAKAVSGARNARPARRTNPATAHALHDKNGKGECKTCGPCDHTDRTPFGRHTVTMTVTGRDGNPEQRAFHEAVPAYFFTCPGCGDPQLAQHYISEWFRPGIAFMRSAGLASPKPQQPDDF